MHIVLRRYRIRAGSVDAAGRRARQGLLPQLRELPEFHAYYLVSEEGGILTSISLFRTADGAAAGDRLCADWFRADWPTFRAVGPETTVGEILVQEAPAPGRVVAHSEGDSWEERRCGADRRRRRDRRGVEDRRTVRARLPYPAASEAS
jgi:hypothetical protein